MPIKPKPIVDEIAKEHSKTKVKKSEGMILLEQFVQLARGQCKGDEIWETLRQEITPKKYKTVDEMFVRWAQLVKH